MRPLQTELIGPLDLSHVKLGSSVLVRMDLEWSGAGCTLRAGSIVQGHVTGFVRRSKAARDSTIELVFDAADCGEHAGVARGFTLVSLVGPAGSNSQTGQSGVTEAAPLSDLPLAIGGLRNIDYASQLNNAVISPTRSLPSRIKPGEVVDLRHVSLSVGTGTKGATVITATNHDLRLERGTSLILVPDSSREVTGTGAGSPPKGLLVSATGASFNTTAGSAGKEGTGAVTSLALAPPPEPPDETEICSGVCSVVTRDPAVSVARGGSVVAARLPIHDLGYSPRDRRLAASFDEETNLTYLNADNLLCTFDPHMLRERSGGDDEESTRSVRAVLIDATTHAVKRVMSWRVRGEDQYLWRLSDGRVLVHLGRELRMFDSELRPLRSIPVSGRVAWVVTSPSSDHLAIGTVKERYTAYVYRQLREELSEDPEEDIEVRLFDGTFTLLGSAIRSSKLPTPVLSDAGELRLKAQGRGRWQISEYHWDKTERMVATTKSTCRPVLSAPQHGLIFAVGCTAFGGRWYRMLREDGHPVLKGESPSDEIEQSAEGSVGGVFAVRIVKTVRPWSNGQPFSRADLTEEELAIYRSSDGAALSGIAAKDFTPSQHSFALSPSGSQMALVGSDSILFYPLKSAGQ